MKKGLKITLIVFLSVGIISGIIIPLLPFMLGWNPAYGVPEFEFPFENPDDIVKIAAYHTPDWGEPGIFHNGIDLQIDHPSILISPCNGVIEKIWYNINPYSGSNVAMIHVLIRINYLWTVKLVLEPWANTTEIRELQISSVVPVGAKLETGDIVGTLLFNYEYPHLHYMIMYQGKDVCPYHYSSPAAQAIFEEIALRTNSTICYC
ncbi:MAG: hypothetical protein ACFFDW_01330 [Candidatus Thorarchaeota archaeon]